MLHTIFLSLLVVLLMLAGVWLSQRSRSRHGPFVSSRCRICNWTNCARACAITPRCSGSGWLSIPSPSAFRCSNWVRERTRWRSCSSTGCASSWPPFCLPLFTSDGLTAYFYALTAHFGHWIKGAKSRRKVRQWQVAAGLLYGQVQKSYRRRHLVRVKQVIRLGTEPAFKAVCLLSHDVAWTLQS